MIFLLAVAFLGLSPGVVGFSTFTPNCTASNLTVNYVAATGYRSTLDILWSSLFTIIACTWTVLHLNVPEQRNGRDPGFWGDAKWALKGVVRNIKWMVITILAPEWTLGLAAERLNNALSWRRKFREMTTVDGVEFTLTHAFYSEMGGFVIRVPLPSQVRWTLKSKGEDAAPEAEKEELPQYVNLHLTAKFLYILRGKGYIKKLPSVTAEQINDKSKSDVFTKIITAIQVFFSITQVIVRHTRKLTISQLELAVCAFSVCAVAMYLLALYQPKGVKTVEAINNDGQKLFLDKALSICERECDRTMESSTHYSNGGFDRGISHPDGGGNSFTISIGLAGVIFGGIHCCGWFFTFPTNQELLLWRICSIMTVAIPIFTIALFIVSLVDDSLYKTVLLRVASTLIFVYIVARLYIIVEIFRSLFYLPPDAFVSTWTKNIPQVS